MDYHKNMLIKTASADMSKGTAVLLDSTDATIINAAVATSANAIGVALDDVASGDSVAVALLGVANRSVPMIASAAISAGAKVYLTASGKVQPAPTSGTVLCVGVALTEATADADLIEVAHRCPQSETFTS